MHGYGENEYIETTRPLVVVTAPGPSSGKLATCISQLYHDYKKGINSNYAKFETFPVWNLPLKHPVNISYEAATADLDDMNMIDPFHLQEYNEIAVNYNRDIEVFPVVKNILYSITGTNIYNSPTDMGVNMVGFCITNEEVVSSAAKQEVIRRYYKSVCDFKKGTGTEKTVNKLKLLMKDLDITEKDRDVVMPAIKKMEDTNSQAIAIKLHSGGIITGRTTAIMTAGASVILNALKYLSNVNDEILLISESVLKPIQSLKSKLHSDNDILLDSNDILTALSVCAVTNPLASMTLSKLPELYNTQAHSTHILKETDEAIYRNLKILITSEPNFISNKLYKA